MKTDIVETPKRSASAELVVGMPFDKYVAAPGLNWSTLKHLRESPKHFRHAQTAPREDSRALRVGRLSHTLALEPELFTSAYAVWKGRRSGKEWEAFEASATAAGKDVITEPELNAASGVAAGIGSHPEASRIVSKATHVEASVFWDKGARALKARLDLVSDGCVVDIKTASNADPRTFAGQFARLGYHMQLAWYCDAMAEVTGREHGAQVICVESTAPNDVIVYDVPGVVLDRGREENAMLLDMLDRCEASGEWPGRFQGVTNLEFPEWALGNGLGITIGGEGF